MEYLYHSLCSKVQTKFQAHLTILKKCYSKASLIHPHSTHLPQAWHGSETGVPVRAHVQKLHLKRNTIQFHKLSATSLIVPTPRVQEACPGAIMHCRYPLQLPFRSIRCATERIRKLSVFLLHRHLKPSNVPLFHQTNMHTFVFLVEQSPSES